jgi:hypothetical protein
MTNNSEAQSLQVYYNVFRLSLTDDEGRVKFARCLYNLFYMKSDQDQDAIAKWAVFELNNMVERSGLKSLNTQSSNRRGSRKRARTDNNDDDDRSGGSRDGHAQLRAHGYEVQPEVFVDASGGEWSSLCKVLETFF